MRPKAYPLLLGTRNRPAIDWNFAGSGSLPAALTFSRASLATMYDASGTLVWCPHNLIARSGDASGAEWIKNDVSVAGTTLTVIAAGGSKSINQWIGVVPAGLVTLCLRVRASTSSRVSFGLYSGGFVAATASISSGPGAVSGTSLIQVTGLSAETQSVIVLQATVPAGGVTVYIYPGGDEYGGNAVGDSVEFDDIRLNVGPLQPYYPTTSAAYYGPRLTYDPVTHAALGLLVEEQRTNRLTYSDQLDNAAWYKSGATVAANATAAPDGAASADKLVESATTGSHETYQLSLTVTGGVAYTLSFYVKAAGRSQVSATAAGAVTVFGDTLITDLASDPRSTSIGAGWYRVAITGTASASGGIAVYVGVLSGGVKSYTGDGSSGVYLWGLQFEAGAFATSYIPTGAASATRAADVVTCTGSAFSSWFNATEGTLVVEFVCPSVSSTIYQRAFSMRDNAETKRLEAYIDVSGALTAYLVGSAGDSKVLVGSVTPRAIYKAAIAADASTASAVANGGAVSSLAAAGVLSAMQKLTLGNSGDVSMAGALNSSIKRIRYWPRRLTNAQLQALTA